LYTQKPATDLISGLENELSKLKRVNLELNEQYDQSKPYGKEID